MSVVAFSTMVVLLSTSPFDIKLSTGLVAYTPTPIALKFKVIIPSYMKYIPYKKP